MLNISLKSGPSFVAAKEKDLLTAGLESGVYLEHSCRTGRCSSCKAKLIEGETEILLPELGLAANELAEGYILSCCRRAKTDLLIEAECLDVPQIRPSTRPCKIETLQFSGDVALVTLRLPPGEAFRFYPGQYIQLAKGSGPLRSYSIASAPRADGKLELHIKRQPGGVFGEYLFGTAKVGDLLKMVGPMGSFLFRNNAPGQLIFLATGTGIAPVKAILEQLCAQAFPFTTCRLYWGNRSEGDFHWQPNSEIASALGLRYRPVLSRSDKEWTGARGHVQAALLSDVSDFSDAAVYACGSEAMIFDAKRALLAQGLASHRFYSDAFVASN